MARPVSPLQLGAEVADFHPGGTWWVELAGLSDPELVSAAVASAVGVRAELERPLIDTLGEYLAGLDAFIVLDNCEQVLSSVSEFADTLLRSVPDLAVLATSREPLGIAGELAWRVPPLDRVSGEQLFVDRAALVRPGFLPDEAEIEWISRICERLDGLPLAIELAAARTRMMSPAAIAAALEDRFRLLTGGGRTAQPRQQTLEASVAWSHDLLDEPERALLRRLSVFNAGFTLEAAEVVCAYGIVDSYSVLDLLGRLVDKSLVQARRSSPATGCWRPSATTPGTGCSSQPSPTRRALAISGGSLPTRSVPSPNWARPTDRCGWTAWTRSTTTSSRRSSGQKPAATMRLFCASSPRWVSSGRLGAIAIRASAAGGMTEHWPSTRVRRWSGPGHCGPPPTWASMVAILPSPSPGRPKRSSSPRRWAISGPPSGRGSRSATAWP